MRCQMADDKLTVMVDASLAKELGCDWRIVFTRAKHKAIGKRKKDFEFWEKSDDEAFDRMSGLLVAVHKGTHAHI